MRQQAEQLPVLVAPSDERRELALLNGGRAPGRGRLAVELQPIHCAHGTRRLQERGALLRRDGELVGKTLGEPARGAALVGLDLADGKARAGDALGERLLGEVERLAAPPQPVAKRICPLVHPRQCLSGPDGPF
jgi:hypothetical protein